MLEELRLDHEPGVEGRELVYVVSEDCRTREAPKGIWLFWIWGKKVGFNELRHNFELIRDQRLLIYEEETM